MGAFKKLLRPGTVVVPRYRTPAAVFVEVEWDGTALALSGVVGPTPSGNAVSGGGQLRWEREERDAISLYDGWDRDLLDRLFDVWERWHLNNARPGCGHQMADGWNERRIDPRKPADSYGRHFPGQKQDSWNLLMWVRPDEHPDGLLTKPCPECGYRFGTEWKTEPVPEEVLTFLAGLPDSPVPLPGGWGR